MSMTMPIPRANGRKLLHDPIQQLEVIRYARNNIHDDPAKNKEFKQLPHNITYGELVSLIDSMRPTLHAEEAQARAAAKHYRRDELLHLFASPLALRDEVLRRLTPTRYAWLDWYVKKRRRGEMTCSIGYIMDTTDSQYMRMAEEYARYCVGKPLISVNSRKLKSSLTVQQIDALAEVIHLRLMGLAAKLDDYLTNVPKEVHRAAQVYMLDVLHRENNKAKAKAKP